MLLMLMLEHYISEFNKLMIAVASPKKTTMFGIKDCLDGLFFIGLKKLISKVNFIIRSHLLISLYVYLFEKNYNWHNIFYFESIF